jgi:hypothetical protein
MDHIQDERILNFYARLTGFLYVFVIAVATVGSQITDGFHVAGDYPQTAANIQEGELKYRIGLAIELMACVLVIPLAGATYVLLKGVNKNLARIALLWRVGEAVLGAVYMVFAFLALSVYTGIAGSLGPPEQEVLARMSRIGVRTAFTFAVTYFSFGSAIFFWLLLRSRFIPRALAVLGILASVAVTIYGFVNLILPQQASRIGLAGWAPIIVTELVVGFWLLTKGADQTWWRANLAAGKPEAA